MPEGMIRDPEEIDPSIALWGPAICNPPHVSLIIGGQFPQASLRDYLLVSKEQLRKLYFVAQASLAVQPSDYVTITDLTSVPTTSTVVIDTWYGSALVGDLAVHAPHPLQSPKPKMKRVPAKDEGLFFDPDDFIER